MAENNARFSFPGFQFIGSQDSDEGTHEEMSGLISLGKKVFNIQLVRSKKVGEKGSFLPSVVEVAGKKWMFWDEKFEGIAMLAMADEMPIIAFIPRGVKKIERILLLEDIASLTRIEVAGNIMFVGKQRPVLEVMSLKRLAGQYLKIGVIDSDDEKKAFRAWLSQQAEIARVQRKEQEEAKKEERMKREKEAEDRRKEQETERLRKVLAICNRSKVRVFSDCVDPKTGRSAVKYGIPVTEEEWPSLPDGAYAILVENDGGCDVAKEAFWVNKTKGGRLSRSGVISVSFEAKKIGRDIPPSISAEKTVLVDRGKGPEKVLVFKTSESIKDAAQKGLNSGALVAIELGNREFEVSSISAKRVTRVGTFNAI
jgi:hypothetical protein